MQVNNKGDKIMKEYTTPLFEIIQLNDNVDVLGLSENTNWENDPWAQGLGE